jgi:hypothetical protein
MNDYYVYVYIDPRNFEEFYYGKGTGSRKNAHLADKRDNEKAKRIAAIRKEGLQPIVRVIARGLSEPQALLVEKTLLWKLKGLANITGGHFTENFRPHDTLHLDLSRFDYRNGFYYYNVGEGPHRNWDDHLKFGFISAGQGRRWGHAMLGFQEGDGFAAYLKRHGFVGVGRILSRAKRIGEVTINGTPLLAMPLRCRRMGDNSDTSDLSEYVCLVKWLASVPRDQAKWRAAPRLYTTTHVRASLDGQPETVAFIEKEFGVSVKEIVG